MFQLRGNIFVCLLLCQQRDIIFFTVPRKFLQHQDEVPRRWSPSKYHPAPIMLNIRDPTRTNATNAEEDNQEACSQKTVAKKTPKKAAKKRAAKKLAAKKSEPAAKKPAAKKTPKKAAKKPAVQKKQLQRRHQRRHPRSLQQRNQQPRGQQLRKPRKNYFRFTISTCMETQNPANQDLDLLANESQVKQQDGPCSHLIGSKKNFLIQILKNRQNSYMAQDYIFIISYT